MGKKSTQTYVVDGRKMSFYFPALKASFRKMATKEHVGIGALEGRLGDAVGVTSDAVHQWRNERSAPGDLETVRGVAEFFGMVPEDLICEVMEEKMEKLTERQRDALSRVYREIEDYVLLFEMTDGFVWKNYAISDGSPFAKYLISFDAMGQEGFRTVYKDGSDLAYFAWTWLVHALEREWADLGDHPVFSELEAYIDEPLLDMWNGKTDPDYRFDPPFPGEEDVDRSNTTERHQALRGAREIIMRYM